MTDDNFTFNFEDTAEVETKEKTPEETSEKEEKRSDEEAEYLKIYDALMFQGYYEEDWTLGPKGGGTFRTRTTGDDVAIARAVDRQEFKSVSAYTSVVSTMTLSYAMTRFGSKSLKDKTPEERYAFIRERLPSLVTEKLVEKLIDFDNKVREAIKYGSENF